MNIKKILSLSLLLTTMGSTTVFASNNSHVVITQFKEKPIQLEKLEKKENNQYILTGEIIQVNRENKTIIVKDNVSGSDITINIADSYIVDSVTKYLLVLNEKDKVTIYYKVKESSNIAKAVIKNTSNSYSDGFYIKVKQIEKISKDISSSIFRITDETGNIYALFNKDTEYSAYRTKNIVTNSDIKVGSELILWEKADKNELTTLELPQKRIISNCVILNKVNPDGWVREGDTWFFYKDNLKITGWLLDNNNWYFLNTDGSMATGWIKDKENWYYLYSNGSMAFNTVINNYVLDTTGKWVQ